MPMQLVLFRHGLAIDRDDPKCPPDPQRTLTDEGKKKTEAAARGLAALGVKPELVLSSPYKRAVQTAEIVIDVLGGDGKVKTTEALLPEAAPGAVFGDIARAKAESIVLVGHAPSLDRALRFALDGHGGAVTAMKKAGAACVELTRAGRAGGALVWLCTPRMLRTLGDA